MGVKFLLAHPILFPHRPSSNFSHPWKSCYTLPRPPAIFIILLIYLFLYFQLFLKKHLCTLNKMSSVGEKNAKHFGENLEQVKFLEFFRAVSTGQATINLKELLRAFLRGVCGRKEDSWGHCKNTGTRLLKQIQMDMTTDWCLWLHFS